MLFYLFFQIAVIFGFMPGFSVSACQLKVTQSHVLLFGQLSQSISLPCHVNVTGCSSTVPYIYWYVVKSNSHQQLDTHSSKYQMEVQNLKISSLSEQDDGVYYCAAVLSELQDMGNGTIMTVKEINSTGKILLLTLLVLLSIFSSIILSVIICIHTTRGKSLLTGKRKSKVKSNSTRRAHFGAVVQELCNKRNLRSNKKNVSAESSQENKIEDPRPNTVKEDIYQNVKRTG